MAKDWRSKPRKPAHLKKAKRLSIAVTQAELKELHARAKKAGKTLADYVLDSALGASRSK